MRCLAMTGVLVAALALAGCTSSDRKMAMPGPPDSAESEDRARIETLAGKYRAHPAFARQWGLERIGADAAHARLAIAHGEEVRPGAGVTVGILDSGIDEHHPAFADTRIAEELLPGAVDETGEFPSHGTAVASVIAGTRDSTLADGAQGVAWGTDLAVFGTFAGPLPEIELPPGVELPPELQPGTQYFPLPAEVLADFDAEDADMLHTILSWRGDEDRRVEFLNVSISSDGLIEDYSEQDLRGALARTIEVIAQRDVDDKTIFVWAAGNENGRECGAGQPSCEEGKVAATSPNFEAGLAARITELRGHTVAVVGVTESGKIVDYSNRCGLAADWCIAAPGDGIRIAYFGPDEDGTLGVRDTRIEGGTSFAAPMVTGGLAVMKHRFRGQLSNTDLLTRLLETADRSGRYADPKTYGRGLMDLDAATAPVGAERVATGQRVASPGSTYSSTRLGLGGAVGDSLERSLAAHELVTFDSLGAPFWHRLGDRMAGPASTGAASRLRGLLSTRPERADAADGAGPGEPGPGRWEMRFLVTPAGLEDGHLHLAGNAPVLRYSGGGLELNAFSTVGMEGRLPVAGTELAWREGPIVLRSGWLTERESALGTRAEGAFGSLTADGVYLGFEADTAIDAWQVYGSAEIGLTWPAAEGGLIESVSPLTTSGLALHAERALGANRRLRVSVSQPLRVEAGRARLLIPVGRTPEGGVVSETVSSSLSPSGRQVDLSAQLCQRLDAGGKLRIGAYLVLDPGHRAYARPELDLLAGYRVSF